MSERVGTQTCYPDLAPGAPDITVVQPSTVTYEQPLNEVIRTCLRLSQSFQQIIHAIQGATPWNSRAALSGILDVLSILDRPDLKSKLSKALQQHHDKLAKLIHSPKIDTDRLQQALTEIHEVSESLIKHHGKFAQGLREDKFLDHIRLQLQNGVGQLESAAFRYWLNRPAEARKHDLTQWHAAFSLIESAVNLLLSMIRDSTHATKQTAQHGFFEMALDQQQSCQLVQVIMDSQAGAYPEISVSRHHLCIRFLTQEDGLCSVPVDTDIAFSLKIGVL